jgi:hypothetical protein
VTGIGEAFGNPLVTREYFRMLEPMFVGRSIFDFDHVEARVRNAIYHLGVGNQLTSCLAGINVALWDAMARGFGVRVCDLIGGCGATRFPAYASTGFFSNDPDRQLEHMMAEVAAHPYAGTKIKIGRGIKSDVERVKLAREAIGPDKLLLVDINGAYTADVALECARAIEPFDIHWIEEPLPPGDFRGYAELRARSPIALAAGEAHHTVRDFRALIDGRCIDIVQPLDPGCRRHHRGQAHRGAGPCAAPAGRAACLGRRRGSRDGLPLPGGAAGDAAHRASAASLDAGIRHERQRVAHQAAQDVAQARRRAHPAAGRSRPRHRTGSGCHRTLPGVLMAPVIVDPGKVREFKDAASFYKWLGKHHDRQDEVWIKIHKVGSGLKSITPKEAIDVVLCWGWIDAIRKGFDDKSFPAALHAARARKEHLEQDQRRQRRAASSPKAA